MSAHLEPFSTAEARADFLAQVMKFPPGGRRDRGLVIHRRMELGTIDSEGLAEYALREIAHVMNEFADTLHEAVDKIEELGLPPEDRDRKS